MKKVLCGLLVVSFLCAPLAAMAGTTLYGNARISLNYTDNDDGSDANYSVMDNVSRLGVKGTYGDAIKAFFHLEASARVGSDSDGGASGYVTGVTPNADGTVTTTTASSSDGDAFGQRFYYAGLSGGFGRLAYGRMTNAYKMPGFKLNGKLYDTTGVSSSGAISGGGASYGLSGANNGFSAAAVQYDTPSMAGLKLSGTVAVDGTNANDHGYIAAVSYSGMGIDAGVVYATNSNGSQIPNLETEGDAIRGYASYTMKDKFSVGVSVENIDIKGDGTDDKLNYVFGIGSVKVAPIVDLIASVGFVDDGPAKGVGGTLGVNLSIAENTEVLAAASYTDLDSGKAPLAVTVCFVHNFSLSN